MIAKLRRGTEEDLEDAVQAAPKDTAIFLFRTIVEHFCARLEPLPSDQESTIA